MDSLFIAEKLGFDIDFSDKLYGRIDGFICTVADEGKQVFVSFNTVELTKQQRKDVSSLVIKEEKAHKTIFVKNGIKLVVPSSFANNGDEFCSFLQDFVKQLISLNIQAPEGMSVSLDKGMYITQDTVSMFSAVDRDNLQNEEQQWTNLNNLMQELQADREEAVSTQIEVNNPEEHFADEEKTEQLIKQAFFKKIPIWVYLVFIGIFTVGITLTLSYVYNQATGAVGFCVAGAVFGIYKYLEKEISLIKTVLLSLLFIIIAFVTVFFVRFFSQTEIYSVYEYMPLTLFHIHNGFNCGLAAVFALLASYYFVPAKKKKVEE